MKRAYESDIIDINTIFYFNDVLENIFGFVSIKELLTYELLSTYHCHFIRTCHFYNVSIKLWHLTYVDYCIQIMNHHQFKNVDLFYLNVNEQNVHHFNQCKILDLYNTNITNPLVLTGNYDYIRIDNIQLVYNFIISGNVFNKSIIHIRDYDNNTLLMHACTQSIDDVKFILSLCGNYINVLNFKGKGVLYYALLNNDKEILNLLLQHGLDYTILLPNKKEKIDIVHFCLLIKEPTLAMRFIDCNIQPSTLSVAIRLGYNDIATLLIHKMDKIDKIDQHGHDALFYAVHCNNFPLTILLMNKINTHKDGYKLLLCAAKNKNKDIMEFIHHVMPTKINVLEKYYTTSYYDHDIGNFLIKLGKQVTLEGIHNYFSNHDGSVEDLAYFYQFGFDINKIGNQLLTYALKHSNNTMIHYLVLRLNNFTEKQLFLMIAHNNKLCKEPNMEMLSIFFDKCHINNKHLIFALEQQCCIKIIKLLLCATVDDPEILYEIIKHFDMYESLFIKISNHFDNIDIIMEALYIAISWNRIYVVKALLPKVPINHIHKGQTLLIYAIIHSKVDIIEYLIKKGANINMTMKKPPIYYALQYGHLELLVNAGADIDTLYNYGNNRVNLLLYALMKQYRWLILLDEGIDVNYVAPNGLNVFSYLTKDYTRIRTILMLLDFKTSKFLVEDEVWDKLSQELMENGLVMQYDELRYFLD